MYLVLSDAHLGLKQSTINDPDVFRRLEERIKALQEFEKADKVEKIIFLGDMFDYYIAKEKVLEPTKQFFKNLNHSEVLKDAERIFIIGNHDLDQNHHFAASLKGLLEKKCNVKIQNSYHFKTGRLRKKTVFLRHGHAIQRSMFVQTMQRAAKTNKLPRPNTFIGMWSLFESLKQKIITEVNPRSRKAWYRKIIKYYEEHPDEKMPDCLIFGHSHLAWMEKKGRFKTNLINTGCWCTFKFQKPNTSKSVNVFLTIYKKDGKTRFSLNSLNYPQPLGVLDL